MYIEILLGDAAPTLGKCSKEQVLHWLSTEAEEERERMAGSVPPCTLSTVQITEIVGKNKLRDRQIYC